MAEESQKWRAKETKKRDKMERSKETQKWSEGEQQGEETRKDTR